MKLAAGDWTASLQLEEGVLLPFQITIKNDTLWEIRNGEEHIKIEEIHYEKDQVVVTLPVFGSTFKLSKKNASTWSGVWNNHNKKDYEIPLVLEHKPLIHPTSEAKNIDGRWAVTFSPNTNDSYPAIGVFEQKVPFLTGTFLTETGDYRYLEGGFNGDTIQFGCFDGAHAFLFKATLKNHQLNGTFWSGTHWKEAWEGIQNDSVKLKDMRTLTYIKDDQPLTFAFPDINGDTLKYTPEAYKGKAVIVQILGSWCPNCMDETRFLVELHNKYHHQGLEIIGIDFEPRADFAFFEKNAQQMIKDLKIPYPIVFGGIARKSEALKALPMLNAIISYPTAIFINKEGIIEEIHTGFSGPGTGTTYKKHVQTVEALVRRIL